jgi:hypothetical protein
MEEEEEEVEGADEIRGVVALSVMWMASDGCWEGRFAMLGKPGAAGPRVSPPSFFSSFGREMR